MDNGTRDNGGGISMVHRCGLKNLLTVKVRALDILKLRTTRKKRAKDRPTVIPTRIAFWPGEKELNLHIKHFTWNLIIINYFSI